VAIKSKPKMYIVITDQSGRDNPPIVEHCTAVEIYRAYLGQEMQGVMIIDGEIIKGMGSLRLPSAFKGL
tara:strand:+ start:4879 stop:5085 length:207 start_codon:yes stop_codon:yes gene_type:complete